MAPRIDRETRDAYPSFRKALEKLNTTSCRDGFFDHPPNDNAEDAEGIFDTIVVRNPNTADTIVVRTPNANDLSPDEARLQAAYAVLAENEQLLNKAQAVIASKRQELATDGNKHAQRKLYDEINDLDRSVKHLGNTVTVLCEQVAKLERSVCICKNGEVQYNRRMKNRKKEEERKKEERRLAWYGYRRPSLIVKLKIRVSEEELMTSNGGGGKGWRNLEDTKSDVEMVDDEGVEGEVEQEARGVKEVPSYGTRRERTGKAVHSQYAVHGPYANGYGNGCGYGGYPKDVGREGRDGGSMSFDATNETVDFAAKMKKMSFGS